MYTWLTANGEGDGKKGGGRGGRVEGGGRDVYLVNARREWEVGRGREGRMSQGR